MSQASVLMLPSKAIIYSKSQCFGNKKRSAHKKICEVLDTIMYTLIKCKYSCTFEQNFKFPVKS